MTTSVNTGLSEGDFHRLGVLSNGVMTDILTLIGGGGGGGTVSSVVAPLALSNTGVLSVSLAGLMSTSHEANKIAAADLVHGQYDIETKTLTLKNGSSVTAVLSVGLSGLCISAGMAC